jgi:membrane protease YdiL (CAAX protease family)
METSVIAKYRHPLAFYILATIIPWFFWFLAGYVSHIEPYQEQYLYIASGLSFIGLLAPVIVAYILIYKEMGLRRDVAKRFFNFRDVNRPYFLLACFIMPVSIIVAQAISLLFGYSTDQFLITGQFTFSSGIFPVWFLLIIAPIIEELAWHSYGIDCLRNKLNLFNTSLIFGLYWGIWHMPLSTIRDYYQSNLVETGWIYGVNFLVSIIPYVILMNWLYYKTNRNILVTIIFHITAGFFNEIFAPHPDSKIIQTILLTLLAIYVVIKDRSLFLHKNYHFVGLHKS